mgnify:CR=1 FL=1
MGSNIVLSVIITAYEYGNYIEDAIVSALQQSLPRESYEIIVVDDGSTDSTRQIAAKYLPRIVYCYKENGGQASAFNLGLGIARGEYVAFLDADDYWHPDKLQIVLTAFKSDPSVDVVYHPLNTVDADKRPKGMTPSLPANSFYYGRPVEFSLNHFTPAGSTSSGMSWRRDVLKKLCPIPEVYRICADGYLMCCAPLAARKFHLIGDHLGYYRLHGGNNYAQIGFSDSLLSPRSNELASYYKSLCMNDLIRLSRELNKCDNGLIREIRSACLTDDLLTIRQQRGVFLAVVALWRRRGELSGLPWKLFLFRVSLVILKLLVPFSMTSKLQRIYMSSSLCLLVLRYIKNDRRIAVSKDQTSQSVISIS